MPTLHCIQVVHEQQACVEYCLSNIHSSALNLICVTHPTTRLVHQKSLTMHERKSLQSVLSAQLLVAISVRRAMHRRSEVVSQKYLWCDNPKSNKHEVLHGHKALHVIPLHIW